MSDIYITQVNDLLRWYVVLINNHPLVSQQSNSFLAVNDPEYRIVGQGQVHKVRYLQSTIHNPQTTDQKLITL